MIEFELDGVIYINPSVDELRAQGVSEKKIASLMSDVAWKAVRDERDRRLAQTDWTQMPDAPLTSEKKEEFKGYRQLLRDIPQSAKKPAEVDWPPVPAL